MTGIARKGGPVLDTHRSGANGATAGARSARPLLRAFVYRHGTVCCTAAFDQNQVVVGRLPAVDLVLDCDMVSRNHAIVRVEGERLVIEDLSSRNGVWIAGQAVERSALKPWEPVAIGSFVLRFHLDRQTAAGEATAEVWALGQGPDDEHTLEEAALALDEPAAGDPFPLADLLEPEARSGPQGPGAGGPMPKRVTTLVTQAPELRRTSGVHSIRSGPAGVEQLDPSSKGGSR